ncbi:hypothetical protein G6K88_14220 [Agrobacterium rhizogenes]|uniref:hypothetical protein n=1 Tax=Rhizobium rhizogenes TaxID=359 RepID=UPI00115F221B|nr:hypothetical protein [Rhizobium rhizogenes]NTI03176.1 hypothetical protein [Rhizobium rhizogenes]NTI09980.1 hypothetical protein [Rhizobium rhizogenes]TRB21497.1 hypothetical protein EXN70_21560 [Rhizobium rhizogenes]
MADGSIWTTREIMTVVISTGIFSALASSALSWIGDLVRSRYRRKDGRTYLCMRIAATLEAYAINCAESLEAAEAHYGQTKIPAILSLPDPPVYPEDVDWHSLEPDIAYRVMSFLNEREAQAAAARYVEHFEGNPFGSEEAVKTTGKRAHELANVLRSIADLQPPDFGRMLQPLFK